MKIGELAQAAQCTVETVRYYEKQGLLSEPARAPGNFRVYEPEHLERLRFIRNCRALDMSHEEIRTMLQLIDKPQSGCGAVNAVFDEHIAHVEKRLLELTQLKQRLEALRQRCQTEQTVDACGILNGLAAMQAKQKPGCQTHLS